MTEKKFRIGMVGSSRYEDRRKIREIIFSIKEKMENSVEICTTANNNGAEKYIKKYSLEFGLSYVEFPPSHMSKTLYSVLPTNFYDKPYSPRNYFIRDNIFSKYIDKLVIYQFNGQSEFENLVKLMKKLNKDVVFIK